MLGLSRTHAQLSSRDTMGKEWTLHLTGKEGVIIAVIWKVIWGQGGMALTQTYKNNGMENEMGKI